MTGHRIYARHRGVKQRLDIPLIKRCVKMALMLEGVLVPCEVSVLITDDEGIRAINNDFRGMDKPTDVLSFPMSDFVPGAFNAGDGVISPETGLLPLGDIVLSADRVAEQAREYGQTLERETVYLVIHSVLHLLGYDHVDEAEEKARMRMRERCILQKIGFADEEQF